MQNFYDNIQSFLNKSNSSGNGGRKFSSENRQVCGIILLKEIEKTHISEDFESYLSKIGKEVFKIMAVDISKYNCVEVDFLEDLENANKLF